MIEIVVTPNLKAEKVYVDSRFNSAHHLTRFPEFYEKPGCKHIISGTEEPKESEFVPIDNGFVHGVLRAYNQHHNLVIRPDDIWLAILVQFSRFVEANSEQLRHQFVAHSEKKNLTVVQCANLMSANYGDFAKEMSLLLKDSVIDESLYSWIMPSFTTTTENDKIVGSVIFMASMKKYFNYFLSLVCGIPSIRIAGSKEDWEDIKNRVKKLRSYGKECETWVVMLNSILQNFCDVFDSTPNLDFWQRICHCINNCSGPSYMSGWISAFCVFDGNGKWQGDNLDYKKFSGSDFDNGIFPAIEIERTPPGYVTVDFIVNDNGEEYNALMFAGHTGFEVQQQTWVAPRLCWAVAIKNTVDND